jgi:hypothetical protein
MEPKRRIFLSSMLPAVLAMPLGAALLRGNSQEPRPPILPQDPTTPRPNLPPTPEDPFHTEAPKIDPKVVLTHNQLEIKEDTQKLFALASALKEQVNKTDSATVLSLPLVQKAEEIEKLAKQIKNLARGS